jgi:hypothetical protein
MKPMEPIATSPNSKSTTPEPGTRQMVIVSVANFESGTFHFPAGEAPLPSIVTITDPDHTTIRFSILQS